MAKKVADAPKTGKGKAGNVPPKGAKAPVSLKASSDAKAPTGKGKMGTQVYTGGEG